MDLDNIVKLLAADVNFIKKRQKSFDNSAVIKYYRQLDLAQKKIINPFADKSFYIFGPDDTFDGGALFHNYKGVKLNFIPEDIQLNFCFKRSNLILGAYIFLKYTDHLWYLDTIDENHELCWSFFLNKVENLPFDKNRADYIDDQERTPLIHDILIQKLLNTSPLEKDEFELAIHFSKTEAGWDTFRSNAQRKMFILTADTNDVQVFEEADYEQP